jgi:hypothetical protein
MLTYWNSKANVSALYLGQWSRSTRRGASSTVAHIGKFRQRPNARLEPAESSSSIQKARPGLKYSLEYPQAALTRVNRRVVRMQERNTIVNPLGAIISRTNKELLLNSHTRRVVQVPSTRERRNRALYSSKSRLRGLLHQLECSSTSVDSALRQKFWQICCRPYASPASKVAILAYVNRRIFRLSSNSGSHVQSSISSTVEIYQAMLLVFFPEPRRVPPTWVIHHATKLMSPSHFSNSIFKTLAYADNPDPLAIPHSSPLRGPPSRTHVVELWRVVCFLTAVERNLVHLMSPCPEPVLSGLATAWKRWSGIEPFLKLPPPVYHYIGISFLRCATATGLLDIACSAISWLLADLESILSKIKRKATYLKSLRRALVLANLRYPKTLQIVRVCLDAYPRPLRELIDPPRALPLPLIHILQAASADPSSKSFEPITVLRFLLANGNLATALDYSTLTVANTCELLWDLLAYFDRRSISHLTPVVASQFATLFHRLLVDCDTPEYRLRQYHHALLLLVNSGQGNAAVQSFLRASCAPNPATIQEGDLATFFRTLCMMRKHKAMVQLLEGLPPTSPVFAPAVWQTLSLFRRFLLPSAFKEKLLSAVRNVYQSLPHPLPLPACPESLTGPRKTLWKLKHQAYALPATVRQLKSYISTYLATRSLSDLSGETLKSFNQASHVVLRLLLETNHERHAKEFFRRMEELGLYGQRTEARTKALNILLRRGRKQGGVPGLVKGKVRQMRTKNAIKRVHGLVRRYGMVFASRLPSTSKHNPTPCTSGKVPTALLSPIGSIIPSPDRVSLNEYLCTILNSGEATPSPLLRHIFDRLILDGYPYGAGDPIYAPSTRKLDDKARFLLPSAFFDRFPPHKTQRESVFLNERLPGGLKIATLLPRATHLKEGIDLKRHVMPLYKMFARAFEERGDDYATWKVAKILRQVQKIADELDDMGCNIHQMDS